MCFSVVYSFIDNDTQWSKFVVDSLVCASWVHNILTTVMTRIVVDKTIYHAKPHSICFLPQYQRQRKCFLFFRAWPRSWHKERASVVYNFILQNERFWLAITTSKSYHKNSESSDKNESWTLNSRKYNFNCSVTANIQAEFSMMTAAKRTHWHLQWCSHGRSHLGRPKHWSLR